jgi:hypothetical protein
MCLLIGRFSTLDVYRYGVLLPDRLWLTLQYVSENVNDLKKTSFDQFSASLPVLVNVAIRV